MNTYAVNTAGHLSVGAIFKPHDGILMSGRLAARICNETQVSET